MEEFDEFRPNSRLTYKFFLREAWFKIE